MSKKKLSFNQVPVCEECGKEDAVSFSFFVDPLWQELPARDESKPIFVSAKTLMETPVEVLEQRSSEKRELFKKYHHLFQCRFVGMCTADTEKYYVQFDRFFLNPLATIDWLAHLREKIWFDADDFFRMMKRFRVATNSFREIR